MPSIRPLETLHNALSLRQLDAFLEYVTATIFKTPCPSPRLRSPLRSNPFVFLATCDKGPSINKVGNWKGRGSNKLPRLSYLFSSFLNQPGIWVNQIIIRRGAGVKILGRLVKDL